MPPVSVNTPKHIILVDDHADIRQHLGDLLVQMGYSVEVWDNGQDAISRGTWPSGSVMLLDMRMPQFSGLDVQKALLKLAESVAVVFISGESQPQEIVEAMKQGAVDFLIKPFGKVELQAALVRAFDLASERTAQMSRRARSEHLLERLSERERDVLWVLLKGHTNRSAAKVLALQADTVKKHRAAIYQKLLVEDLSGLLALFPSPGDRPSSDFQPPT